MGPGKYRPRPCTCYVLAACASSYLTPDLTCVPESNKAFLATQDLVRVWIWSLNFHRPLRNNNMPLLHTGCWTDATALWDNWLAANAGMATMVDVAWQAIGCLNLKRTCFLSFHEYKPGLWTHSVVMKYFFAFMPSWSMTIMWHKNLVLSTLHFSPGS